MSFWNQFSFPDPMTEMAGRLFMYHDLVLVVVVMVLILVGWFLVVFLMSEFFFEGSLNRYVVKNELLETVWTVVPSFFLGVLGFVSLKNLYDMEVGENVDHVVKVTGHQWYWEYRYEVNFEKFTGKEHSEYLAKLLSDSKLDYVEDNTIELSVDEDNSEMDNSEINDVNGFLLDNILYKKSVLNSVAELFMKGDWFLKYDSYLVPESDLENGKLSLNSGFRNQDVSSPCYLAYSKKNEVLVSTSDVMHSWGVSELGVKADAVPGRMNSLSVEPICSGVSFGNCYELCGEGHSQMPILVLVSDYNSVIWILKKEIMLTEPVEEFFEKI